MPRRPLVTLYGRKGCSLCDQALLDLQKLAPRLAFDIETVDIESDDQLLARFMVEIPVIALEGEVLAKAPIWAAALEDILTGALRR